MKRNRMFLYLIHFADKYKWNHLRPYVSCLYYAEEIKKPIYPKDWTYEKAYLMTAKNMNSLYNRGLISISVQYAKKVRGSIE